MIRHHPTEDRLAAYAAGGSSEAESLLVASHLVLCPDCRRRVGDYEALGGMLLEALPAEPLAEDSLARTLARLDRTAPEAPPVARAPAPAGGLALPRPICNLVGQDMTRLAWRPAGPGVLFHRLPVAGARAWLLKVRPGRGVPDHGHSGEEAVMVLAGSYRDGEERYGRGDVQSAGPETRHRPIAEPGEDCLCLVVIEGRLRFANPLGRLYAAMLGF
ncbi:MAG TPA: ChrR family anti-sigma-E factor [Dongiaceae bacterium]|nr:ChrR family anti-sigma-E factor [Dongiaceae bacterium]